MILRAAILVLAAAVTCLSADQLVFAGEPEVRVDSDGRENKTPKVAAGATCKIVKRGRGYVWASRDNRKLNLVDAGDYVYYISPEGSGYVKVLKSGKRGSGFDYMEHLSSGFTTVTYWGKASGGSR